MPARPRSSPTFELSLPPDDQWVLHHVLLDRIERERTGAEPIGNGRPSPELYLAFEALDRGETSFSVEQLTAMQDVLAAYQRATDEWELERARIERLLRRVATTLESARSGS